MRVTYKDNVLKVVTDIKKETIEKGIADLVARDDKGGELYRVSVSKEGHGAIDQFGLTTNSFVEDNAAVVMVLPADTKLEDVQRKFGAHLVKAAKYTDIIAAAATEKEATIASIFSEEA